MGSADVGGPLGADDGEAVAVGGAVGAGVRLVVAVGAGLAVGAGVGVEVGAGVAVETVTTSTGGWLDSRLPRLTAVAPLSVRARLTSPCPPTRELTSMLTVAPAVSGPVVGQHVPRWPPASRIRVAPAMSWLPFRRNLPAHGLKMMTVLL